METKKYYDPEYDRIVNEEIIKKQYECFCKEPWFHESYEKFKNDNFEEIQKKPKR